MSKQHNNSLQRDLLKLSCFLIALTAAGTLFLWTPTLTLPTLSSIILTALLAPAVTALERRGLSRHVSIVAIFTSIGAVFAISGLWVAQSWQQEWLSFQSNAPSYFSRVIERISHYELNARQSYPILKNVSVADSISKSGGDFGAWFMARLPAFAGEILNCLLLVPILTFCFLSEGRNIRRAFFQLVPNRFFESIYIVSFGVTSALSDFLRAKLIQAILIGGATTLGLVIVGSPYAIVLGIWAGFTNILPYIGPVVGAIPGILIAFMDAQSGTGMIWGTVAVYGATHLLDNLVIFPAVVAKLVKLNPLVLIASVIVGEYYFGIVGMLISIPLAAALKVIFYEFYVLLYGFVPEL